MKDLWISGEKLTSSFPKESKGRVKFVMLVVNGSGRNIKKGEIVSLLSKDIWSGRDSKLPLWIGRAKEEIDKGYSGKVEIMIQKQKIEGKNAEIVKVIEDIRSWAYNNSYGQFEIPYNDFLKKLNRIERGYMKEVLKIVEGV